MGDSDSDSRRDRARWPLSFQMSPTGHKFWSHRLYRGPHDQPVKVLYSRTKLESEEIAHEFLDEKVVGFDMEWLAHSDKTPNARLQELVSVIQIASEHKIAIFHIGLHPGTTAKDLLAPALRKIIEDPAIKKCGVAVYNADFARLQRWFGLHPRGAFELSHLHNLITHGAHDPTNCTRKLRKLKVQVEQHLGLPLNKGEVRTSNWSKPLSAAQVEYAAADAYAGFMLYHCMNAKRADMNPTPPLPVFAETYGHAIRGKESWDTLLQLAPADGDARSISVLDFYTTPSEDAADQSGVQVAGWEGKPEERDQAADDQEIPPPLDDACEYVRVGWCGKHPRFAKAADVGVNVIQQLRDQHAAEQQRAEASGGTLPKSSIAIKAGPRTVDQGVLDEGRTELLFQKLKKHRRDLAKQRKCAAFIIAYDTLLHAISRNCPRNDIELLRIKGIGKVKVAEFGPAWLAIVKDFVRNLGTDDFQVKNGDQQVTSTTPTASNPRTPASQGHFDQTIQSTPTLHTGVSFSMQNASLRREIVDEDVAENLDDSGASDDASAFGSPLMKPSSSALKRKREEIEAEHKLAPTRPEHMRARNQVSAERAKSPPQLPPTATITRPPQILSTPPRQDMESIPVLFQTSYINRAGSLAAQGGPKLTTPAHASPLQPAPLKESHPTHEPAAQPEMDLQPAAKQSSSSNYQETLLRNKIKAFNKLVTCTIQLPADTIEHLVNNPPRTMQELLAVPGILPFANACSRANRDLLGFLDKSAPATR
ncbi:hypothetical protein Daus18300_011091 [Diaporthe australafricana]|uniref:HRDC domain-containing protein n=1 Tax=Diaporthe australafricana TaxID=127596 RepID=A0ABR3W7S0_9PEZI